MSQDCSAAHQHTAFLTQLEGKDLLHSPLDNDPNELYYIKCIHYSTKQVFYCDDILNMHAYTTCTKKHLRSLQTFTTGAQQIIP